MIAGSEPLQAVLDALTRFMEEVHPGMRSAVLLLAEMGDHLRVASSTSIPEEWKKAVEATEVGFGIAPFIDVVCHRHAAFVEDILKEERWEGHRGLAGTLGLRACWAAPVIDPEGIVLGAFVMVSDQARRPEAMDTRNVRQAGLLAGIALHRHNVENALRESEARYRSLFMEAPAMLHSIDSQIRLVSVSNQWLEVMGYSQEEVIGRKFTSFLAEESRKRAEEEVLPALFKTGSIKNAPYQLLTKSGKVLDVLLSSIMLRDSSGAFDRSLGVVMDVTLQKKMEERLARAQRLEVVGRLAGGVAHEFNNLLTGLKGYAFLAQSEVEPGGRLHMYLDEILKAADRAAAITQRLLAYGRRQVLVTRMLDLGEVVAGMEESLRRGLPGNIEMELRLEPSLDLVKADQGQIEQIIATLTNNARDAMPGGGKLTVETANTYLEEEPPSFPMEVLPGPYVMLAVRDTGTGMPPEMQARLFEPFLSTWKAGPSAGLGLSAAYGIVRQSGGHIRVASQPGEGTVFKVFFPRAAASPKLRTKELSPARMPGNPPPHKRPTLLLAEDEEVVREFTATVLEQAGYSVRPAADGEEALRILSSPEGENVQLIITDLLMPRLGGAKLAEQASLLRPGIPVLFVSSFFESLDPGNVKPAKEEAFLTKPFKPSDLVAKVNVLLKQVHKAERR